MAIPTRQGVRVGHHGRPGLRAASGVLLVLVALGAWEPAALLAGDPSSVSGMTSGAAEPAQVAVGACALGDEEQAIVQAIGSAPEHRRPWLTCQPILVAVARARAEDMARRGYFGHTNLEGLGPNYLLRQAGYFLPAFYPSVPDANSVESIGAGGSTPEAAWRAWMGSPLHRAHLLGLQSFYADQVELGVGHAFEPTSRYGHYWAVITARPGP